MCALVTGVQTCALPIFRVDRRLEPGRGEPQAHRLLDEPVELPRRLPRRGVLHLEGRRHLRRNEHPRRDRLHDRLLQRARKSVVSGKSVSVRVDLGGRRSSKKKTQYKKKTQKQKK